MRDRAQKTLSCWMWRRASNMGKLIYFTHGPQMNPHAVVLIDHGTSYDNAIGFLREAAEMLETYKRDQVALEQAIEDHAGAN